MIANISITCFAASYLVALGLEVSRIFFRSGVRGAVMLGFAAAGLFAHSAFLLHRWISGGLAPLSSEYDWCLVAAWVLALVYLYLTYYHPRSPIGLFTLPLVLGLVLAAQFAASETPFPKAQGTRWLGMAHGVCLLLGTVAVIVGFVSGLMYLLHAYRLKHKLPQRRGLELPNLEWLERVNGRAIFVSVGMLLCGFLAGVALSNLRYKQVYWSDPVVWTSSLLVAWMAAAAVFNAVYKPSRLGRKIAYLTIASFVFLVFTLTALLLDTAHGVPAATNAGGAAVSGAWRPVDGPAPIAYFSSRRTSQGKTGGGL